jgi:putative flippase GtrA
MEEVSSMSYRQRRANERAKIAAMPMTKRIAMVLVGIVATIVGASLVGILLDDEVDIGVAALLAAGMGTLFAYHYLWAPSRRP